MINLYKKYTTPYHRLLHGPEIEIRREAEKFELEDYIPSECDRYKPRNSHLWRGRLSWIDRLNDEIAITEVNQCL